MDDRANWVAFALTHVEYVKGDQLGMALAAFSLAPITLLVVMATLVLSRRDLQTISFMAGLFLNEFSNVLLKRMIQQPRPVRGREHIFTEYGMPSSHAQFVSFFMVYVWLILFVRFPHFYSLREDWWKYTTGIMCTVLSLVVCYSRVYLGYHYYEQVAWGYGAGTALGVLWFLVVQYLLGPYFYTVTNWRICEYLMIRDLTLIPNVMWFEYTTSRTEAKQRQRKFSHKGR